MLGRVFLSLRIMCSTDYVIVMKEVKADIVKSFTRELFPNRTLLKYAWDGFWYYILPLRDLPRLGFFNTNNLVAIKQAQRIKGQFQLQIVSKAY